MKALRWLGYAVFTAAEAISDTYDRARRIGRALLPRRREDAFPLSHKAVEHQLEQIRRATTILPPPPQRARCRCGAYHYRQDTNDCQHCEQERSARMQMRAQERFPPHPRG